MATPKTRTTTKSKASEETLDVAARKNNNEVAAKEKERVSLVNYYTSEPEVTVVGAPMYRAYFGNNMPISINGILVSVPLNGQRYNIPRSFAEVFNARINSVNEEIEMQRRRSNIAANEESYPGELDLVRQV